MVVPSCCCCPCCSWAWAWSVDSAAVVVSLVCCPTTADQSSPSTAMMVRRRRSRWSSVSCSSSSPTSDSPMALRSLSFLSSYRARSASLIADSSMPRSAPGSHSDASSEFPGGTKPSGSSVSQRCRSLSIFCRVAIVRFANTMARTNATRSEPKRRSSDRTLFTTLREYPTYWQVSAESYTANTPSGDSRLRASVQTPAGISDVPSSSFWRTRYTAAACSDSDSDS
mmetsp:Transcript_24265/g.79142  ORF Transcript_24265/g.79142 Transcript_24265/m.79142 type:complete len:226 (+) Transcript_24265:2691-3368(+)